MNKALVASTILAFGFSAFFRKLSVDKLHPYHMQIVAAMVYMMLIPMWYHLAPKSADLSSVGLTYSLITTLLHVAGAVMFGLLLKSGNTTGALSVMVSASPIITVLLSVLFLQEEFKVRHVVATLLTLSGLALFTYGK